MRKFTLIVLQMLCVVFVAQAQSFKLYYANNVTDVSNLDDIEKDGSGLNWREVATGSTIAMDGNLAEVTALKRMFAETRMKNLTDKRQFWKMRDHTLLCFRIDENGSTQNTYKVLVRNGKDTLSQTVDDFFFVNAPEAKTEPYEIIVSRVDDPTDKISFKYYVYDWDNENLYLFMLDQKRQVTGETYTLEYVTGYMDGDGNLQKNVSRLDLKDDKFQSFYVPANSDLLDVFLMSGEKKLRLDKNKLHTGIDLNDRMRYMEISPTFDLDKHEGREMMNFNWIGTGLYEKYDSLFVSLFNEKGKPIRNATLHPERVDYDGNRIYDPTVRYIGYDAKSKQHKILTMGNPSYIEIIVDGYLPVLYKYDGATDEEGIVNIDRCQALINMRKGTVSNNSITISDQHFLNLNDERAVIIRNNIDHRLCSIDEVDISGKVEADTLSYMDDCGNKFPKLLNNQVVEHFAQLEVSFSRPKGNATPNCVLTATNVATQTERTATDQTVDVVRASEFTSFTYDYFYVRFNLVDVINKGEVAKLSLKANDMEYARFPFFRNLYFDRDATNEAAQKEVDDNYSGANDESKFSDAFADAGYDMKLPAEFKFSLKPLSLKTSVIFDIRKSLGILKIGLSYDRGDREGESEKVSEARRDVRNGDDYDRFKWGENRKAQFVGEEVGLDDWIYDEADDIFDVQANRIGVGFFGGANLCFKMPVPHLDLKRFQVSEAAGQIGWGYAMQWDIANTNSESDFAKRFDKLKEVLRKFSDYISLTTNVEGSLQADFGIKSYDSDVTESMSSDNMGFFAHASGKLAAGATLEIQTPERIGGFKLSGVVNLKAGLRVGAKFGGRAGIESLFSRKEYGYGGVIMFIIVGQAYANLKSPIFQFSANAGFRLGGRILIPDENTNPFHDEFPYWIKKNEAKPFAQVYRPIPAPESNELIGKAIVNDLAVDANPHFLGENRVVYNDMGTAGNYNDDKIMLATIENDEVTKQALSSDGLPAYNNMRSKQGNYEIVAYEQMTEAIDGSQINEQNVVSKNSEIQQKTRIKTAMRQGNGSWTYHDISDTNGNDGNADLKPMVAIQEDGHAAVVYQHGKFDVIDENVSADSLDNLQFKGQLLLRTYNGTRWSDPVQLYDYNLDKDHIVHQYDLIMRKDTVLVATTLVANDMDKPVMRYASKTLSSDNISYYDEALKVKDFYMKRVGGHGVIAMIYEKNDSINDIYVKTIAMTGKGDGIQGNDLGVGENLPGKVKIVSDDDSEGLDNFAVLWTQMNNVYRGNDGKKKIAKDATMMLHASRIYVSNALQITDPVTLGAEIDSLVITDFDGYLDDAHICAVYTLTDITTSGSVLMYNDKFFSNSYTWNVSYGSEALLGSSTLPIIVTVDNTGTSAIEKVTAIINGQTFEIEDSHIKPYDDQEFVIQYPIDDSFDGYVTSQVIVEFDNIFNTNAHPRNRAKSYLRQASAEKKVRVTLEDVECNVLSHTIENGQNVFLVELIDHAKLHDDMVAAVGVFDTPDSFEELSDSAVAIVTASDFEEIAGVRKAFATLYVDGVTEPIQAYINCHLVDWSYYPNTESMVAAVRNVHALENPALVNLFPTEDPTTIVRSVADDLTGHKVKVTKLENGVRLDGLVAGKKVRLFRSDGITEFKKEATGNTMFIPLTRNDVYLLSTGEEVFKFSY